MKVSHEFGPCINKDSKVLILGSIPSVKSRELDFTICIHKIDFGN